MYCTFLLIIINLLKKINIFLFPYSKYEMGTIYIIDGGNFVFYFYMKFLNSFSLIYFFYFQR